MSRPAAATNLLSSSIARPTKAARIASPPLSPPTSSNTSASMATAGASVASSAASKPQQSNGHSAHPAGYSSRVSKVASRVIPEVEKGPDVWTAFNPVVFPTAVNLGQGFMNFPPPEFARNAFIKEAAERTDVHHYVHVRGSVPLRKNIAKVYGPSLHKPAGNNDPAPAPGQLPQLRKDAEALDDVTEVQVTAGANAGLYSIFLSFFEPGDEVILLEPFFADYLMPIKFTGAEPVYVPMTPPKRQDRVVGADEWKIDFDLLRQKLQSGKVRAIVVNTPHNPVGKVFTLEELQQLASLCIEYDLMCVSDEVYDCLTFDDWKHHRIAALEGMWNRTITVCSAGKSFSCTGWRVGWLLGPEHLLGPTLAAHSRILFSVSGPAQAGVTLALEEAEKNGFWDVQRDEYQARRQLIMDMLDDLGVRYSVTHGTYFIMADFSSVQIPDDFQFTDFIAKQHKDWKLAYFIAKTCDVVCIPTTPFSSPDNAHIYENYLRLAFCKDGGQIPEAAKRLQKLKPYLRH